MTVQELERIAGEMGFELKPKAEPKKFVRKCDNCRFGCRMFYAKVEGGEIVGKKQAYLVTCENKSKPQDKIVRARSTPGCKLYEEGKGPEEYRWIDGDRFMSKRVESV